MSPTGTRNRWLFLVIAALLTGGLAGSIATAMGWVPVGRASRVPLWVSTSAGAQVGESVSFRNGFVPVAEQVLPAVVNVSSSEIVRSPGRGPSIPFFNDPFLDRFFGDNFSRDFQIPQERRENSLGSGVVVSPEGYILTNHHVVEGAVEIEIVLPDQRQLDARVVGTDPATDIAVLKVEADNLRVLRLGDSSKIRTGDFAIAVGNPFGIGQTVTMGIVSATGRGGFGIEDLEDFIQTDAAINPGNSGGALVNVDGDLIGINTAIISSTGGSQGVGFAVPVNMARNVMEQILQHGKVTRGWLGVTAQPVGMEIAEAFQLSGQPRGALVAQVAPGSPASRAGLSRGDIVLEINGEPVTDSRALSLRVAELSPGSAVRLNVFRGGKSSEISVTLGERPVAAVDKEVIPQSPPDSPRLGLSVQPLTPEIAQQLRVPVESMGVVVNSVLPGSAAERAGIRRADIILQVNREDVPSIEQFQNAIRRSSSRPILLLIRRGQTESFVVVESR